MRVASVAAALFAGLAFAVPTPPSEIYEWAVTGWVAGCTAGYGCFYGFAISGPAAAENHTTPARPAFKAQCSGLDKRGPETQPAECYRPAKNFNGSIHSRLREPPALLGVNTVASLEVNLTFADPKGQQNTSYVVIGYANTSFNGNLEQGPLSFNITPSTIFGVA